MSDRQVNPDWPRMFVDATEAHDAGRPEPTYPPPPSAAERARDSASDETKVVEDEPAAGDAKVRPP
jgi:hypothetical protein